MLSERRTCLNLAVKSSAVRRSLLVVRVLAGATANLTLAGYHPNPPPYTNIHRHELGGG